MKKKIVVKGENTPESEKTFTSEKYFCPVCGSTKIEKAKNGFVCTNCKSRFSRPARVKVELRKRPSYIG